MVGTLNECRLLGLCVSWCVAYWASVKPRYPIWQASQRVDTRWEACLHSQQDRDRWSAFLLVMTGISGSDCTGVPFNELAPKSRYLSISFEPRRRTLMSCEKALQLCEYVMSWD